MKILDAGHRYRLDGFDDGLAQELIFMKREGPQYPFNSGSHGGTNCQEVLRAIIDRCEYLQKQKPCAETEAIIGCLKTSLFLFEARAARTHGHSLECDSLDNCQRGPYCPDCGHMVCERSHGSVLE